MTLNVDLGRDIHDLQKTPFLLQKEQFPIQRANINEPVFVIGFADRAIVQNNVIKTVTVPGEIIDRPDATGPDPSQRARLRGELCTVEGATVNYTLNDLTGLSGAPVFRLNSNRDLAICGVHHGVTEGPTEDSLVWDVLVNPAFTLRENGRFQ